MLLMRSSNRGELMLKLKQYFCRHDYELLAKHNSSHQNLYKCKKCDVFLIQHYGLGAHYKCVFPNIDGWEYFR
jgi:hypothetical protein